MGMIKSAAEVNTLASAEPSTGGVYFVTAFSGLLAPYWDPSAAGLLIGGYQTFFNVPSLTHHRRSLLVHHPCSYCEGYIGGKCIPNQGCGREYEVRLWN